MSIPRQVGKTYLVAAIVFALCLLRPGMTVVWTAHRMRLADETFGKMQVFAKKRKIAPFVRKIILGSGEEEIAFHNGSRILFGARERGFGLGFDEVDVLIFDEAQRLSDAALDDMVPATNQSRQDTGALLLFLGTPPRPADNGEVFKRMRTEALSGEDSDTGWIEFGADPDFNPTPPPAPLSKADWEQVAKANPSYPDDTPRESILRMRKKLGAESFLREGLGIWDPTNRPTILPNWPNLATNATPPAPAALGLAVDPDQVWVSLGAASAPPVLGYPPELGYEPRMHLGVVLRMRVDGGKDRFVAEVQRIQNERGGIPVAVDKKSFASFLIGDLEAAGVYLLYAGLDDWVQACADIKTGVEMGTVEHGDYPELNEAVEAAGWRSTGDRRVFARKNGDISALESATWAAWGAATLPLDAVTAAFM